jgi:Glycosyl hydrolases family 32 C terminal
MPTKQPHACLYWTSIKRNKQNHSLCAVCRITAKVSGILLLLEPPLESLALLVLWEEDAWMWLRGDADQLQDLPVNVEELIAHASASMKGPLDVNVKLRVAGVADTPLEQSPDAVELQLFVDGSAVEVFTSTGKAASTRLYMQENSLASLHGISSGGESEARCSLFELNSIWKDSAHEA